METHKKAAKFFENVIRFGKPIIAVSIVLTITMSFFIPNIKIDTSVEAFIEPTHPSLVSRNQLKETFGLSDPIILAIENNGSEGIYDQNTLELIQTLTDTIQKITGVDPERVVSLASENNIGGDDYGLIVEPFLEDISNGAQIRENVEDFPLYVGNLVSEDGSVTLIVIELLDKKEFGKKVYNDLLNLVESLDRDEEFFVAGEGAVVERLGQYVQDDAKLMTPLAFLVITIVLLLAYRTLGGLLISNMVIIGSLIISMGIMVANDIPFYLISNIIPVIIIAISVADSIHVLGVYYEHKAKDPGLSKKDLTIKTMTEMWRPIIVTSATNIVGFIAMGYSSDMPPMRAVGLYSSLGVVFALLFSLLVIPVILSKVNLKPSKSFSGLSGNSKMDSFGLLMDRFGRAILNRPKGTMVISLIIVVLGIIGMAKMELNDTMVNYFNPKENIYQADQLINERLNGTNYFDISIETDEFEGLLNVDRLSKIDALQRHLEKQPHVKGTTSIVDIMKQINRSVNEGAIEEYRLPDSDDLIAQYFLLYSTSGSPTDFDQYVDLNYQLANVRVMMDNGQYKYINPVIENAQAYIDKQFNDAGISAEVSGWLNVVKHWIGNIEMSHYIGVLIALIIVFIISSISFSSMYAGVLAMIPVIVSVFLNYAIMGFTGIWLKVSTSITVAIAIGVAVDFAIHTIDRLILLTREQGKSIDEALLELYPNTGRALLFNLFAIALGFGTNMVSSVPPWATFGLLVLTMVSVSFVASLTLLPVLIKVLKPKFLSGKKEKLEAKLIPVYNKHQLKTNKSYYNEKL